MPITSGPARRLQQAAASPTTARVAQVQQQLRWVGEVLRDRAPVRLSKLRATAQGRE